MTDPTAPVDAVDGQMALDIDVPAPAGTGEEVELGAGPKSGIEPRRHFRLSLKLLAFAAVLYYFVVP